MSELEKIIRQIVREEIQQYFNENRIKTIANEPISPKKEKDLEEKDDEFDFELFEERYQEALKIDDGVREKYKVQTEKHGKVITLEYASNLLNMSKYAIRKLAKKDKNFPAISGGKIGTARLMHWLDGGEAYWNIGENND